MAKYTNTDEELDKIQELLQWKFWHVGEYPNHVFYLEFETFKQYDEWQFDSFNELEQWVSDCLKTLI